MAAALDRALPGGGLTGLDLRRWRARAVPRYFGPDFQGDAGEDPRLLLRQTRLACAEAGRAAVAHARGERLLGEVRRAGNQKMLFIYANCEASLFVRDLVVESYFIYRMQSCSAANLVVNP